LPAALLGLSVGPLLAANGGYYAISWGWTAMALAWAAAIAALLRERRAPTVYEFVFAGGLAAFALWLVVSMAWTETPTGTPLEIERTLVYVAAAAALLAIVRRDEMRLLLGGVCAGATVVCAYALATRLLPDHFDASSNFEPSRLSGPVGYWNGLGLVAAMSLLLALGLAARARSWAGRAGAGAAVPILIGTLYFTFSRGSWGSLAIGLAVLLAFDRRRVQLALVAAPLGAIAAVVVAVASRQKALTDTTASLGAASHSGHGVALVVLVACLVAAAVGLAAKALGRARSIPDRTHRLASWAMAGLALVALVAVFVRFGSPVTLARRAYHSFTSPPAQVTNLNNRLFSLSSNGRIILWKASVQAFEAHPIGGIGAGAFSEYWAQHQKQREQVQDAHSLYVETLAETGIIGFLLLMAALAAPLVGFWRVRHRALSGAALAAYVAYLVGAGVDWDWELAGVTLVALLCGGAILVAGRDEGESSRRFRLVPLALGTVIALAALYGLIGNLAISRAQDAYNSAEVEQAAAKAQSAEFWAPWSAQPWQLLGDSQLALGKVAAARQSLLTAIEKDPLNELLWIDLARASSGREQDAALDRAHELNPLDPVVAVLRKQLNGHPVGGTP
jgi:tetratricopeptide (TPR) repeat protein